MIVVDTSVWIDHLHREDPDLSRHLGRDEIAVHPMVIEELALGSIAERTQVLTHLEQLRAVPVLSHQEVLELVRAHSLHGRGIGVVDANIIGSVLIESGARLWTRDKRMRAVGQELGIIVL